MTAGLERSVCFDCGRERLLGILHPCAVPSRLPGVLIVVGGPQYRVGSHRQFVQLARGLAASGFPAFRFDCRGMGDSSGVFPGFEQISTDVRTAIDTFEAEMPGLAGVVVFGLCDAASAALMYCRSDPRLRGLILANPWARTPSGEARSYVQHYYGRRLLQAAFWRKLLTGRLNVIAALVDFLKKLWSMRFAAGARADFRHGTFIDRMLLGLEQSRLPTLILLSNQDLTAEEFRTLCSSSEGWRRAVGQACVTAQNCAGDHTFSSSAARQQMIGTCVSWLRQLGMSPAWRLAQVVEKDASKSGQLP